MKLSSHFRPQPDAGYALLLTLMFLGISLLGFGSLMYWVSTNSRITERNNMYVDAQAAAESATENVLATMMRDFTFGKLNAASTYQAMVPDTAGWPVQFAFQSTNGVPNTTTVSVGNSAWSELPSQFHGLYGYGQNCVLASTATTVGQNQKVSSTVMQTVWFGTIPLFQYAIFYNLNMEINPGVAMTVNGRVHSNYNIYATGSSSGSPLKFTESVDATGLVTNTPSPLDPQNYGHRQGNAVYANTNSPVSYTDSLTMPIGADGNNNPTNVRSILNLPPASMAAPNRAAYATNGQVYLYNASDLIISNSPAGINGSSSTNQLKVFYQNPYLANSLVQVKPNIQAVQSVASNSYTVNSYYTTNINSQISYELQSYYQHHRLRYRWVPVTTYTTNVQFTSYTNTITTYVTVTNYYYSFVTNQTFYDYREKKTVQAVQVNVANLNAWLASSGSTGGQQYEQLNTTGSTDKGHGINSIYVYSSVGMNNSTLPGVQLVDGQQLPAAGLTVATPLPLYVKGNYNITTDGTHFSTALGDTKYTVPAALMGDAITILSGNWNDSYSSSLGVNSRSAVNTTINAATLEGIVQSDGSHYSGGVENFLRLLENWSGRTLTYNGSIVVMFPSQYATNPWSYGSYYTAPKRDWGFDPKFKNSDSLPPLTPQVKATVRGDYVTR